MVVLTFHCILNEKHRNVVANNVPITLIGVEFYRKATHITNSVCRSTATKNSRKAEKDRRLAGCVGKHAGGGHVGSGFEEREFPKGTGATGVNYAFWDTFVVEAVDLGW